MEERMKFISRVLEGEKMTELCREFGISRKTGYKVFNRYKECGMEAMVDRSRRPHRFYNQTPFQIEKYIIRFKKDKPTWGAPKIREKLIRKFPDVRPPAISTIHCVLDRNGLVAHRRKRKRLKAVGTPLSKNLSPNSLWSADFKGQFLLGNKRYCYPLTVTDNFSRYLIACEALENVQEKFAITTFERIFEEYGLPDAIRTDNGVPFASPNSLFNLSRLSVWWLRLGIAVERIKPGNPQQNGKHERMHLTLKKEATRPSGQNFLQQQEKFDSFIHDFNFERPHQALDMKYPSELYQHSNRKYSGISELDYPLHDIEVDVTHCGRICLNKLKISLSTVFAGQKVGLKQVADDIWLVTFIDYDLGYFDTESRNFEPLPNPFGPRLLPMSPV